MSGITTEQLAAYVQQVFPRLEDVTYFDLLGVSHEATQSAIRSAFYSLAADLHPDRYHNLKDLDLKEKLEAIYARICEGYRVLTTPDRRAAYERALAEGKKRLVTTDRESHGPQNPEDTLKHPEAKKFFRLGMICLSRKDFKGAVMNFTFARTFEPAGAVINQKLAEAQAGLGKPGGAGGASPPKAP